MRTAGQSIEEVKTVLGGLGLLNSGGLAGDRVSLKNYRRLKITIGIAPASGTDTAAITLKQSKTVDDSPSTEKALAFTKAYRQRPGTSDARTELTVAANSITTSAAAALEVYEIEIEASDLDTANDFDCVRADVTDPGSVSTPAYIQYDLYDARYGGVAAPSAIVD